MAGRARFATQNTEADDLKNESTGIFKGTRGDTLLVISEGVGVVDESRRGLA